MSSNHEPNEALVKVHGVSPEASADERIAVGKAAMVLLASGRPLKKPVREAFFARATEFGASPDELLALERFDCVETKLEDLPKVSPRVGRHLMFELYRLERVTGQVSERGRARLESAAEWLGVKPGVVAGLQGMVEAELALAGAEASIKAVGKEGAELPPQAAAGLKEIRKQYDVVRGARLDFFTRDTRVPAKS